MANELTRVGPTTGKIRRSKEEVDRRVNTIARMMARDRWQRGRTVRRLALKWDVPEQTIRTWAATASRLVWNDEADDIAALKATTIANFRRLATKAESTGDLATAVKANVAVANVAGLHRTASEVTRSERQVFEHLMSKARELCPELVEEARQLAAEREDEDG